MGIMVPTSKVAGRIVNMTMYRKCPAHSRCSLNVSFLFYLPIVSHASITVAVAISVHHQYDPHIFLYINSPLKLNLSSTNRKQAALGKHLLLCLVNTYWVLNMYQVLFQILEIQQWTKEPLPSQSMHSHGGDGQWTNRDWYDIKWHKARLVGVGHLFHFVGPAELFAWPGPFLFPF